MANTVNPYPEIGTELEAGLNAIVAAAPTNIAGLVTAIYGYIQPIYYPGTSVPKAIEVELKSVVYNMINAYNNKAIHGSISYNSDQLNIIRMMLGLNSSNTIPINALENWLADIEDNISKTNLSIDEQTPLLLAIECAKSVNIYWKTEVDNAMSNWGPYFETESYKNYVNISLWTVACIEGALLGGNASTKGLIAPTTEITSVNIVSALIGALTIGAGKIIFKWVPRIELHHLSGLSDSIFTSPYISETGSSPMGYIKATWGQKKTNPGKSNEDAANFTDKWDSVTKEVYDIKTH